MWRILGHCGDSQMSNKGNGGKSLSSEAKSVDVFQILVLLQF